ncbi:hypothetical protein RXV95_09515 [Novosphingobium sp. ZN18A2]|uniref:hypothetical protein n=1 Tax=Novosphingobium sp. ZN18A2 TaxID=3079861 RepID=UPI0030D2BDB0
MNDREPDLAARAMDEAKAMAKEGMGHPSTRPVLIGTAVGAVAGALLPVVSVPLGMVAGAGFAFWQRIKR